VQWALRSTDLDAHGHVNNVVYWQAVEDRAARDGVSLAVPFRAELDYRDPIDLDDRLELSSSGDGGVVSLGFCVGETVRAVARISQMP
jgi:acyl-ACP thioesterase